MHRFIRKALPLVLALSLMVAFVCALCLLANRHSTSAAWLPAVSAAAVPVAGGIDINFRNERNQLIGEGRPFPLDRVARDEKFTVEISNRATPVIKIMVRVANGFRRETTWRKEQGTFRFTDKVPTNPSFDDVMIIVYDNATGHELERRRLPIGKK